MGICFMNNDYCEKNIWPDNTPQNNDEICFFCTTPFQVMGAIAIVINENLKNADIYIYSSFNGYEKLVANLEQLRAFRNIFIIDYKKLRLEVDLTSKKFLIIKKALMLLLYIKNLIFLNKTADKYLCVNAAYKRIYISSNNFAGRIAILSYIKRKLPLEVYHYDDGVGSYYGSGDIDEIKLYDKFFRKLFFGNQAVDIPFTKQLFSTDFYQSVCKLANATYPKNMKAIKKMEPLVRCKTNDLIISSTFSLTMDCSIMQRFVFFETIYAEDYNSKGCNVAKQIVSLTQKTVGVENIIFKFHPRDKDIDSSLPHIENTSVPFECFCYFNDFSDKVLISNYSTAVITPKIFYDQEPTIVFLYKIMSDYLIINVDTTIVDALKAIYRDKSKIIIPESIEELAALLEGLR